MAWSVRSGLRHKHGQGFQGRNVLALGFSAGISIAGLRVWQVLNVSSGESRSEAWYLVGWPPVSQWWPLISRVPCT